MAAMIETDRWSQQNDSTSIHVSEDEEGLGRSYVCSISSAIDLESSMDGNYAGLALNVQRYLSRIVEELHLISAWSSSIYQHQPTVTAPVSVEGSEKMNESSLTAMARLAVVTDIALLRRDVAEAQHELFQRCSAQMTFMRNETSTQIKKQSTMYDELQGRIDDKQRALDQQAQAIQTLKKTRVESDTQMITMASTLHKLQEQTSRLPARISVVEKSINVVTTAQLSHTEELQTLQRRVDTFETAHQLQMKATRDTTENSLTELRSAQSQLSAKMQVIRLEMQELNENTEKRMQQLLKAVASVMASVSGKSLPTGAVAPRRPSAAISRTPRSGGNTRLSQAPGTGESSCSLDNVLSGDDSAQVLMVTAADPMAVTDSFIYAKAALPHYNSTSMISTTTKKPFTLSTGSNRAITTSSSGINVLNETKVQDAMTNLLTVKQSVLSVPLGYEVAEVKKESTRETDRSNPLISTKQSTHRLSPQTSNTSRSCRYEKYCHG